MTTFNSKKAIAEAIKVQITSNDNQAIKAMLKVYEYQTDDEQAGGYVRHDNGMGFAATDSEILTSFCHQYERKGWLSAKQIAIIKNKIGKYAGQLLKQAIERGLYIKKGGQWVVA